MNYVLFILGLLILCVPDDAGVFQVIFQSLIGLGILCLGAYGLIKDK